MKFSNPPKLSYLVRLLPISALILCCNPVIANSNLPPCEGSDSALWNDCFGTSFGWDGGKYEGAFKNGRRHGRGTDTFANGTKYVGEFETGYYHGQGTLTFANGDQYVGEFKDGRANGQGTHTFSGGAKYVGEWKHQKYSGRGTLYAANGSIFQKGVWRGGILVRSEQDQQVNISSADTVKLRADAEEAKFDNSKKKCSDLGFKSGTEGFGKCVLQLSK